MLKRIQVSWLLAGCAAVLWLVAMLAVSATSAAQQQETQVGMEMLREIEAERLRALVDGDMEVADRLHADDFQLINPFGFTLTKEDYLGQLSQGVIDYTLWEPVSEVAVRYYGDSAVVRYRAALEILVMGQPMPSAQYWHTDAYELRNGQWQVVWSQATEIREMP